MAVNLCIYTPWITIPLYPLDNDLSRLSVLLGSQRPWVVRHSSRSEILLKKPLIFHLMENVWYVFCEVEAWEELEGRRLSRASLGWFAGLGVVTPATKGFVLGKLLINYAGKGNENT